MRLQTKTFSQKPADVNRDWLLLDAASMPLGRLAVVIAKLLIGKQKPAYTAHVDGGDFVVVVNADKLVVTGNKLEAKQYHRYSGYPSGLKTRTLKEQLALDSTKVIYTAVKGMLPKNKLVTDRLARLRIFAGETHDHVAQQPKKVEVK